MLTSVTAQDVATQMGVQPSTLDEARIGRIQSAIEVVETLILDRYGTEIDPMRLDAVVKWVVAEWAAQPNRGKLSTETAVDDARVADRWDGKTLSLADLLDQWWDYLKPASRRRSGAFSISPAYQPDVRPW